MGIAWQPETSDSSPKPGIQGREFRGCQVLKILRDNEFTSHLVPGCHLVKVNDAHVKDWTFRDMVSHLQSKTRDLPLSELALEFTFCGEAYGTHFDSLPFGFELGDDRDGHIVV